MLGYLSPVSHWQQWIADGMPTLDGSVSFNKHTDFNRCRIDSPNGPLTLTIPVQKYEGKTCWLSDVMISEHGDWRHKHWHALSSTYFNSPFFEYYQDDFRPIYFGNQERLVDFNVQLTKLIIQLLDLEVLSTLHHRPSPFFQKGQREAYYQVFAYKHGFLADLSIIDLLFNMGPESLFWL